MRFLAPAPDKMWALIRDSWDPLRKSPLTSQVSMFICVLLPKERVWDFYQILRNTYDF